MINIGEISKPSVPAKTGSAAEKDARSKRVDSLSPIDATRKVKASTRKQSKAKKKDEAEQLKQQEEIFEEEYDSQGKTHKKGHLDLKA